MSLSKIAQLLSPQAQRQLQVDRLKVKAAASWKANNPYIPHGNNATAQEDESPEVLMSGPAGTGKSRAALEKLNTLALKYPGVRGLIVRKTRESLTESALYTFEKFVLGPQNPMVVGGPQRASRRSYRYPNGSEIIVGGLKQSGRDASERVMSTEYDIIYPQEATELLIDEWERLTTRLRAGVLPYQQIIGDANPASPNHWLKKRCDLGKTKLLATVHEDNPRLWDDEARTWTPEGLDYLGRLDRLTGLRYLRLRKGLWVQAEGVIYDAYDPAVHVIDRFDIPGDWARFCSIDFGFTAPFVCQWWAIHPDTKALYRYREIYMTRRTVKAHAQRIKDINAGANEFINAYVCDHDAEDAATLRENGIPTVLARKAISPGIQAVQEALKTKTDVNGQTVARMYFMRGSLVETDYRLVEDRLPTCTEEEIEAYVWDDKVEERPVDKDNHGCDAMRYGAMFQKGRFITGKLFF